MLQVTKSPDYRLGAEYVFVCANSAQIIYYLEGAGQTCLDSAIGTTMLQATERVARTDRSFQVPNSEDR